MGMILSLLGIASWGCAAYLLVMEIPWEWIAEDPAAFRYVPGFTLLFIFLLGMVGNLCIVLGSIIDAASKLEKKILARLDRGNAVSERSAGRTDA